MARSRRVTAFPFHPPGLESPGGHLCPDSSATQQGEGFPGGSGRPAKAFGKVSIPRRATQPSSRRLAGSVDPIRGFAIVNTSSTTVIHVAADNATIIGNFIGIDTDGTTQTGAGAPVVVDPNVLNTNVGSGNAADRNILDSSNNEIQLLGTFTKLAGNYINTNAAGTAALGNTGTRSPSI